ncbi:MAG TPA: matrixin family metalloprotease [Gemmatimonadaceae bacterium]|nr:matrixin family metalloprotease [Gemmatimonadaceae bacterium]
MMQSRSRRRARFVAAVTLALLPLSGAVRVPTARTSVASGGVVANPLTRRAAEREAVKAEVRRRLAERGSGTYIGEMLTERDSALARWPDRSGRPLMIWIQPASGIEDWTDGYVNSVRDAIADWDALELPVRFSFAYDSASADVHVTFIDQFEEAISGRPKWERDDSWWITNADIVLAVHHRRGPALDEDAMRALALHEVGHLLGLDHTEDATSIMAPRVRVRGLSTADRATVRLLYTLPPGGVR